MNRTPFQDWQRNQRRMAIAARVGKFVVALVIVGLLASAMSGCSGAKAEPPQMLEFYGAGNSRANVLVDHETGCQYLVVYGGGGAVTPVAITPRLRDRAAICGN